MLQHETTTTGVKSKLDRVFGFLGISHKSNQTDVLRDDRPRSEPLRNRPDSGGYNEAFIMQHWASYGPRH